MKEDKHLNEEEKYPWDYLMGTSLFSFSIFFLLIGYFLFILSIIGL